MDERLPVSVLLLARDEERHLAALLPSLAFARDIVMVCDPGVPAGVRALAERAGARLHEHRFEGFGPQRAHALALCREPWVLWIDADERLDAAGVAALRALTGGPEPAAAGFWLERRSHFLGRRIRFCGWQGERVLRVFRRDRARFDDAPVHERVHVDGTLGRLPGVLEHHSYDTWDDCVRKMTAYAHAGAEKARRAGRRAGPLDVALRPPLRFLRMYVLQLGVLDGAHGLALCALAAAQVFLKYAELWAGPRARGGA